MATTKKAKATDTFGGAQLAPPLVTYFTPVSATVAAAASAAEHARMAVNGTSHLVTFNDTPG